jgi:hypothetical protein
VTASPPADDAAMLADPDDSYAYRKHRRETTPGARDGSPEGNNQPMEPGELHRYFIVREIAPGREWRLLNGDVRYEPAGEGTLYGYRTAPDGDYFLADARPYPGGVLLRLADVEPLPGGRGLWHPGSWEHWCTMAITYEGSWRQAAGMTPECAVCGAHASEHPYPGTHVFAGRPGA